MSNVDLSFSLEPIFTNGSTFYEALITATKKHPHGIIRIATYNFSINPEFLPSVYRILDSLTSISTNLHLLVGINLHHPKISQISQQLKSFVALYPNIRVRTLIGSHVKCFLTPACGYAGSLNLIHPTLDDLMIRLTPTQHVLVTQYFDRLWERGQYDEKK